MMHKKEADESQASWGYLCIRSHGGGVLAPGEVVWPGTARWAAPAAAPLWQSPLSERLLSVPHGQAFKHGAPVSEWHGLPVPCKAPRWCQSPRVGSWLCAAWSTPEVVTRRTREMCTGQRRSGHITQQVKYQQKQTAQKSKARRLYIIPEKDLQPL